MFTLVSSSSVVRFAGAHVRLKSYVRCLSAPTSETVAIDLSPLEGLEEMELSLTRLEQPDDHIEKILGTVISKRVRKITLDTECISTASYNHSAIDLASWSTLDEMFLKMANTLDGESESDAKLEVVFKVFDLRPYGVSGDPEFLKECRAKATVGFEYKQIWEAVQTEWKTAYIPRIPPDGEPQPLL